MTFLRSLAAELLKLRRTIAFWIVLAAPLLVILLALLMYYERSGYYIRQGQPLWQSIRKSAFVLWSILMLPLYITVQTALLAGLEHGENRWRNLLAMPVPRWSIYFSKLLIPCVMVFASSLILNYGCLLDGLILRRIKPELRFPDPVPWGSAWDNAALTAIAALLVIAIQHWVSLRFSSFAASTGFGIAATVTGAIVINSGKYGPWWPWCLPAQLLANRGDVFAHTLWYSALGAVAVSLAGSIEFSRREIRG
jgi:ABC-2 type transport system permease protein